MKCNYCPRACFIPEDGTGWCRMYTSSEGEIVERFPDSFLAAWPGAIETIPLFHFHPGGKFLLLSTIGCNLACPGCVSHRIVKNPDLLAGVVKKLSNQEILQEIKDNGCQGAFFCLNEPIVSFPTVIRTARYLKSHGISCGCASNGCMSPVALSELISVMDAITIGVKGSSKEAYQSCDAPCSPDQIFENIRAIHESGCHLEVATVYRKGHEDELQGVVDQIREISIDIPFLIMRFIPFDGASKMDEPSGKEAEIMASICKENLNWVYLLNTPGTPHLHSLCPDCKEILIERVFYGPMGARLTGRRSTSICTCSGTIPITGAINPAPSREFRFRGGYRTAVALDLICGFLEFLDLDDEETTKKILIRVFQDSFLENLQMRLSTPEQYIAFLEELIFLGDPKEPSQLPEILRRDVSIIQEQTQELSKPRVLVVLTHPMLPLYPDKIENELVKIAGGISLNTIIAHEEADPRPFTPEQFQEVKPEIILITGPTADISSFYRICEELSLSCPALENKAVFQLMKPSIDTGPSWILTLKEIASYLHPGICKFDPFRENEYLQRILSPPITRI